MQLMSIHPPLTYAGITEHKVIHCAKQEIANIYLRIWHGRDLLLRNISWKVRLENILSLIPGQPVLQYIGCDEKQMLQAACEQYGEDIKVAKSLWIKGIDENMIDSRAALFGGSIFHRNPSAEGDNIIDPLRNNRFRI